MLAHPVPAPALHAKDRHDPGDTRGQQRQRIKGAFAHPQRPGTCLQRSGVEVAFHAREMIVALRFGDLLCGPYRPAIEVHEAAIWRRMRKDHTATPPIPCGMRPGARRCIAHTVLLRQGQGNTALLQVHFAAAAGQSSLKGRELLSQVRACWSRRTRC